MFSYYFRIALNQEIKRQLFTLQKPMIKQEEGKIYQIVFLLFVMKQEPRRACLLKSSSVIFFLKEMLRQTIHQYFIVKFSTRNSGTSFLKDQFTSPILIYIIYLFIVIKNSQKYQNTPLRRNGTLQTGQSETDFIDFVMHKLTKYDKRDKVSNKLPKDNKS